MKKNNKNTRKFPGVEISTIRGVCPFMCRCVTNSLQQHSLCLWIGHKTLFYESVCLYVREKENIVCFCERERVSICLCEKECV